MYEENIRNLVSQRKRECQQAYLSQTMTKKALKRMQMNIPSNHKKPFAISKQNQQKINSVKFGRFKEITCIYQHYF